MPSISFDVEAQLASQLLALLEQEQAVLIGAEVEAMEQLLQEKSGFIQQLSLASQQRYQALAAMGFDASEEGMQRWLLQHKDAALAASWAQFQDVLARSKETNRVNGLLINKHFSRNQQLLDVLQNTHKTSQFYGPDGQASAASKLRPGITA